MMTSFFHVIIVVVVVVFKNLLLKLLSAEVCVSHAQSLLFCALYLHNVEAYFIT